MAQNGPGHSANQVSFQNALAVVISQVVQQHGNAQLTPTTQSQPQPATSASGTGNRYVLKLCV